jgi:hypothetical protein
VNPAGLARASLARWQAQLAAEVDIGVVRNFAAGCPVPTADDPGAMRRVIAAVGVVFLENRMRLKGRLPAARRATNRQPLTRRQAGAENNPTNGGRDGIDPADG